MNGWAGTQSMRVRRGGAVQDAQKAVAVLKKDLRGVNKELVDVVKELDETIARHLTRAERENATVYLQVRCPLRCCRGPQHNVLDAVASSASPRGMCGQRHHCTTQTVCHGRAACKACSEQSARCTPGLYWHYRATR